MHSSLGFLPSDVCKEDEELIPPEVAVSVEERKSFLSFQSLFSFFSGLAINVA